MTCQTEDLACFESYYLPGKKGHSSELLENDWRARKLFKLITRINDFLVAGGGGDGDGGGSCDIPTLNSQECRVGTGEGPDHKWILNLGKSSTLKLFISRAKWGLATAEACLRLELELEVF